MHIIYYIYKKVHYIGDPEPRPSSLTDKPDKLICFLELAPNWNSFDTHNVVRYKGLTGRFYEWTQRADRLPSKRETVLLL